MRHGKIDTVRIYCTTFCCVISLCLLQVIIPKAVLAEVEKPGILKAKSFLPPEICSDSNSVTPDPQITGKIV